ncbi:unnamed protein product, partial [Effrenium voratum]
VFTGVPPAAPPAPVAPAADAVVNADAAVNAVVDGEDTNDVADPFRAGGPFDEQPLSFQLKRVEETSFALLVVWIRPSKTQTNLLERYMLVIIAMVVMLLASSFPLEASIGNKF